MNVINAFVEADGDEALAVVIDSESEDYDPAAAVAAVQEFAAGIDASATADYTLEDEETIWQQRMLLTPVLSWQRQLMYTQQTVQKLPIPQTTVSGYPVYPHC